METLFAFWTRSETEKLKKKKRNELFINQLGKIKLFKLKKKRVGNIRLKRIIYRGHIFLEKFTIIIYINIIRIWTK